MKFTLWKDKDKTDETVAWAEECLARVEKLVVTVGPGNPTIITKHFMLKEASIQIVYYYVNLKIDFQCFIAQILAMFVGSVLLSLYVAAESQSYGALFYLGEITSIVFFAVMIVFVKMAEDTMQLETSNISEYHQTMVTIEESLRDDIAEAMLEWI